MENTCKNTCGECRYCFKELVMGHIEGQGVCLRDEKNELYVSLDKPCCVAFLPKPFKN